MRKLILLIVGLNFLAFFAYAQCNGCNKIADGENIIDLPVWFGDPEEEIIRKIEAQDSIDASEYMQLAISYAQLNAEESKIQSLIERSLKDDTSNSCRMLSFIIEKRKDWNITKNYGHLVQERLNNYECHKK